MNKNNLLQESAHPDTAADGQTTVFRQPLRSRRVAIVGLGYVGLPLSLQFARSGLTVVGLDIDSAKVELLNDGKSFIDHIDSAEVAEHRESDTFSASTDFSLVREASAVVICVPTPLSKNREPDISYVIRTAEAIAPHLQTGTLVVLESTTYPGTTDTELRAALESGSGLAAGEDFHLAFSPERFLERLRTSLFVTVENHNKHKPTRP